MRNRFLNMIKNIVFEQGQSVSLRQRNFWSKNQSYVGFPISQSVKAFPSFPKGTSKKPAKVS